MSDNATGAHTAVIEPPEGEAPTQESNRRRTLIVLAILGVVLLLVAGAFAWYLITKKPLTELPGLNREAMPSFAYSIYGVEKPLGVAVSEDGERVYVTQSSGKRTVVEFDHKGNVLATFSAPKLTQGEHLPVYIAINPTTQDVYVTDRGQRAVYVYTQDGTYKRTIKPTGLKGTFVPLGIGFAPDGTLYVTEVGGKVHRVLALDASDAVKAEFLSDAVPMSFPNGVTADDQGTVFVTDSNNGRLLAFDSGGRQIAVVNRGIGEGDLGMPRGLAVDGDGRIVVIDTTNQQIRAYRFVDRDEGKAFEFIGGTGDQGIADGLFQYPNGAATDSRSNVYVTDRENNRVQVWSW